VELHGFLSDSTHSVGALGVLWLLKRCSMTPPAGDPWFPIWVIYAHSLPVE
jgi:hypothetical protein